MKTKVEDFLNGNHTGHNHGREIFDIHPYLAQPLVEKDKYHKIIMSGLITGCGAGQLWGCYRLEDLSFKFKDGREGLKKLFIKIVKSYMKSEKVGCIICTLGESYFNNEVFLLECGFKLVAEYINPSHGADYKQRMYNFINE